MTVYLEMAMRLRQDLDEAEARVVNLKAALASLEPLVAVSADAAPVRVLAFSSRRGAGANIVDAEEIPRAPEAPETPKPRRGRPPRAPIADAQVDKPATKKIKMPKVAISTPETDRPAARKGKAASTAGDVALASSEQKLSTGREFWLGLMGKRKHTLVQLLDKALAKLEQPEEQRKVLRNRLNAWLYPSVKTGQIQVAGDRGGQKLYQVV